MKEKEKVVENIKKEENKTNNLFEEKKQQLIKKGKENGFITYEILANDLKGIDLRELSIKYDPGRLDINLHRSEFDNNSYNSADKAALIGG